MAIVFAIYLFIEYYLKKVILFYTYLLMSVNI
jgi:hypothetical protein